MISRQQALADLSRMVAEEGRILDTLTTEQAVERAWHPGGPSREELAAQFEARRRGRL